MGAASPATDARDADWAGKRMVAHWAACDEDRVAIAFHVETRPQAAKRAPAGWNRSRTWIVTREGEGARRASRSSTTTAMTMAKPMR